MSRNYVCSACHEHGHSRRTCPVVPDNADRVQFRYVNCYPKHMVLINAIREALGLEPIHDGKASERRREAYAGLPTYSSNVSGRSNVVTMFEALR